MPWHDTLFLLVIFLAAVYFFYRTLKKKSFCPRIFGDTSSSKKCIENTKTDTKQ